MFHLTCVRNRRNQQCSEKMPGFEKVGAIRSQLCVSCRLVDGTKTNSSKSLMYLEGCNPSCGCTVILRDSPSYHHQEDADSRSRSRLSRLKDVFQFLLKIVYHGKLEVSELLKAHDECNRK